MGWIDEATSVGQAMSARLEWVVGEVGRVGDEALGLVLQVWDQLDDLPMVPAAYRIPPLRRQLYGHGAYMGAAPALLADERWRRILAFLMPDVYADVSAALEKGKSSTSLIPMFENNPVMAAFGTWRTVVESDDASWELHNVGIEWDLFIDGELADSYESTAVEQRPELVERILASAVIAHSGTIDTLQESLGWCQHDDVRDTPKSAMGGVEVFAWLDIFARALRLAQVEDPTALLLEMAPLPRIGEGEACQLHTFVDRMPASEAVGTFLEVTGREHFNVVLEMKSLRSTPALFADMVRALNAQRVRVAAVCSFKLPEIVGLSTMTQQIDGSTLEGPREVVLFHFAGDLQLACNRGQVPQGISVMFNGGSLLEVDGWFSKNPKYTIDQRVI
ncbi:MAG: hypothetical protein ACI9MC_002986, partial [Kiritimatiellia bacterium]